MFQFDELQQQKINEAANLLYEAAQTGKPIRPVRDLISTENQQAAYAVQKINIDRAVKAGARIVGRKIGLTSLVVQKQLGVDCPDYGILLDEMDVAHGDSVNLSKIMQPKVEAEIAFVLKKALDNPRLTIADILSAIDFVVPAIEIVASRIENWDICITDTIADNASSGLFVLGQRPMRLQDCDLINCGMQMSLRGEPVSTGIGAACLGSPINSTLWLAKCMAANGQPLKAGEVILSGALGPMAGVKDGDYFEVKIEGLGGVNVGFAQ